MDSHRFDQLTRLLASGASRRRLLKGIAGGVAVGVGGLLRRYDSAAADKVLICHNTGSETNPQVLIEVSVNAIPAHEAHGDLIGVDVSSDPFNCGDCGVVCDDGNACTENICVDGECVFPEVVCDDGIACTVDSCDPATGCVFTPDDSLCDDGDLCTVDRCDPAAGCLNEPVICPEGEVCRNGECICVSGGQCATDADCCAEGERCIGGTCSLEVCEGRECGDFLQCTDDPNCLCFIELSDAGVCADGFQCTCGVDCIICGSSAECPDGFACVKESCCAPDQVCVPLCTLGASAFGASSEPRRGGPTPGSRD